MYCYEAVHQRGRREGGRGCRAVARFTRWGGGGGGGAVRYVRLSILREALF